MTQRRRAALAALGLLLSAPARADTLVDHLNGITLDETGAIQHFAALVIDREGRIARVLKPGEKPAQRPDFAVDGKGAAVIPGLVVPYAHVMALGLARLAGDRPLDSLPPPRPEDRDLAFHTAQQALLARGITTLTDMGTSIEDWQSFRRAGDAGRLVLRVLCYAEGTANMVLIGGPGPSPWLYDGRLKLNGVWLDPARGHLSEIQLKNMMSRAAMDHFQVAVRAADEAAGMAINAHVLELSQTYTGDVRWRVERAAEPAPEPDPLAAIAAAADPATALATVTIAPAWAGFADARLGRIAPGYYADFVMLDGDPLAPGALPRVTQVWIGGKPAFTAAPVFSGATRPAVGPPAPESTRSADSRGTGTSAEDGR